MSGAYQMIPKVGIEHMSQTDESMSPLYKRTRGNNSTMFGTTEIVIIAVVSALVVWLLVGLCLVCYRFLTKSAEECPCESKSTP